MTTHIGLLRAINLGPHNRVSMRELCAMLATLEMHEPRSLLQSGNVVFGSDSKSPAQLEGLLEAGLAKRLKVETDFFVRTAKEWQAVIAGNPFPKQARDDPGHLILMCLKDAPEPAAVTALQQAIVGRETVRAAGRHAYIVYPDGVGQSKLTIKLIEKHLATRGTGRNWNTVLKLGALVGALLIAVVAGGCRDAGQPPTRPPDSPYAAASGVTGADRADARAFHVVPLRPMTGDVEILHGDPEKPGEPFAIRIRELPGTIIPLHSHLVDEHITVVQGTLFFAVGTTWDKAALKELRAGDYAFAPKGSTMFGYSPDGAIAQVHGIGPFTIHWLHAVKTLDDPDAGATFTFRRGEQVRSARGNGTIREGYASGEIIQYVIDGDNGTLYMSNQSELSRP